jgi:hypothetical protein
MIIVYVVLVFCLLGTLVAGVLRDWFERRLPSPPAAQQETPVPAAPSLNGEAASTLKQIIGLSAGADRDGVHLEFYLPPNKRGITSPITSLVSTRQRDEYGTLYEMTTKSGTLYLVAMTDDVAKQVLGTFYDWKREGGGSRVGCKLP